MRGRAPGPTEACASPRSLPLAGTRCGIRGSCSGCPTPRREPAPFRIFLKAGRPLRKTYGIAMQGHGEVSAKADRKAVHGSKAQMAMDGDAPIEVEGYGELAEDGEQAGAQQHGGVAMPPLHGAASSMPAHGSGRVVVDGEDGGGARGKRASSSERARTKAERGHGHNSIHIVTICTSTKEGEDKSATTRRVTRATAAMASPGDRAARGGRGGRGRGRGRGSGRGGRAGRGASTGRSAGRDG